MSKREQCVVRRVHIAIDPHSWLRSKDVDVDVDVHVVQKPASDCISGNYADVHLLITDGDVSRTRN